MHAAEFHVARTIRWRGPVPEVHGHFRKVVSPDLRWESGTVVEVEIAKERRTRSITQIIQVYRHAYRHRTIHEILRNAIPAFHDEYPHLTISEIFATGGSPYRYTYGRKRQGFTSFHPSLLLHEVMILELEMLPEDG